MKEESCNEIGIYCAEKKRQIIFIVWVQCDQVNNFLSIMIFPSMNPPFLLRIRNKGEWKHIITVENEKYLQSQTKRQLGQLGRLWRILSASTICTKWMFWAGWQSALSKGIKQLRQHRVLQVTLSWHSTRWCYEGNPLIKWVVMI